VGLTAAFGDGSQIQNQDDAASPRMDTPLIKSLERMLVSRPYDQLLLAGKFIDDEAKFCPACETTRTKSFSWLASAGRPRRTSVSTSCATA